MDTFLQKNMHGQKSSCALFKLQWWIFLSVGTYGLQQTTIHNSAGDAGPSPWNDSKVIAKVELALVLHDNHRSTSHYQTTMHELSIHTTTNRHHYDARYSNRLITAIFTHTLDAVCLL